MAAPTEIIHPRHLEGSNQPPTATQWKKIRPWLTNEYTKNTERWIREELNKHGFIVSEKMVRMKIKNWAIDTKNKRKAKVPTAADSTQSCQDTAPCLKVVEYNGSSGRQSKQASKRMSPALRRRSRHPFHRLQWPVTEQRPFAADVSAASIARPFSSEEQLQSNRLVFAMACWSEHNFLLRSQGHDIGSMDWMTEFGTNVTTACYSLQEGEFTHPSKVIREVTGTISAALKSCSLESLLHLFQWLVHWRTTKRKEKVLEPFLRNILDLTKVESHAELGSEHPLTIMISAVLQEDISLELWTMLFKAIDLNYVDRFEGDSKVDNDAWVQLEFGSILLRQHMFTDVDRWYSDNYEKFTKRKDCIGALYILAESKSSQKLDLDACNIFEKGSEILVASNLDISVKAYDIFENQAFLEGKTGDLEACEQEFLEVLKILQKPGQTGEEMRWAVNLLQEIYEKQDKDDMIVELSVSYTDLIEDE